MKCPVCVEPDLLITDRQGIEIDYCPKCRGVWLDRGELDKIIDRTSGDDGGGPSGGGPSGGGPGYDPRRGGPAPARRHDDDDPDDSKFGYQYRGHNPGYKKKSLLRELLDF